MPSARLRLPSPPAERLAFIPAGGYNGPMPYCRQDRFRIVSFRRERKVFSGHSHPREYELLIGAEGVTGLRLDGGEEFFLPPGKGAVIPPGRYHYMWAAREDAAYFDSHLQTDLRLFAALGERPPFDLAGDAAGIIGELAVLAARGDGEAALLRQLDLLSRAGEAPSSPAAGILRPGDPSPAGLTELVDRTLDALILTEPGRHHSLEEIAGAFFLSKHYLSRKIRHITGKTAMQCYFSRKLLFARRALQEGALVKEAGYRYGFANPQHFARKYAAEFGRSPGRDKG